ncbi:SHOCT domain-containing protein [Haloferax sp. YSMS24]|uniref:SHOCT domain-containing protein n=1 Tax=Haloferax sp. YSMS24 TaxID=3388425 RepID=UPI00398CBC09
MATSSRMSTTTIVLLVVAALVVIPLLTMSGGMMGGGFGMLGGGMFLWPLLLVGLGLLVYYAVSDGEQSTSSDEALDTLRERYARGELSDEEFEERKRTLERS